MNNNLIPAQITDKNGHLTTRWVKPGADSTSTAANLPVPALPAPPAVNYRAELNEILGDKAQEFDDDYTKFFAKASDDILAYIHEAAHDESKPKYFLGQLSCLMNDNTEDHVVEAWIHLYDMHNETIDDMGEVDFIRGAIESGTQPLNGYDRTNPEHALRVRTFFQFLYETDTEQHATAVDLNNGITTNEIPAVSYQITNPQLADYLCSHPEQVESLITIGNEHPEWLQSRTFDNSVEPPDILREYLGTTAPLQRGVL